MGFLITSLRCNCQSCVEWRESSLYSNQAFVRSKKYENVTEKYFFGAYAEF